MTPHHNSIVKSQFGPQANAYIASAAHAQGADLQRIAAIATAKAPTLALDLGCGGGHVAYAMAPHAEQVTACDLSPDMTAAVEVEAERRGLATIQTCCASAAALQSCPSWSPVSRSEAAVRSRDFGRQSQMLPC